MPFSVEPALEPDLPIVDPHHHIWDVAFHERFRPFPIETLAKERAESGHNIVATVFLEVDHAYFKDGPEELKPVGETRTIEADANRAEALGGAMRGLCAGIVGFADMDLGPRIEPVLQAHLAASPTRFKGIRNRKPYHPKSAMFGDRSHKEAFRRPAFAEALKVLTRMGLSFDAWGFSQQLPDIAFLARAAPDATIILNHVGTPMIIAGDDPADVKAAWRKGIREAAACPNVVVKLGGLMMLAGPGDTEMSSERAAETMRNYMLETIDAFGPNRCMFESNFPVCALRISYGNLWNAYKRLATGYTRTEREAMFAGVAARAYRLAI